MSADELSNIQKLTSSETFVLWKFQLTILLKSIGAFKIVSGESKYATCTTNTERASWEQLDAKGQKIVMCTIDKSLLPHIMTSTDSSQMWEKLVTMFENKGIERKSALMQEFYTYNPPKGQKLSDSLNEMSSLFARIKALEPEMKDDFLTNKIISCLPDAYNSFTVAWRLSGKTSLSELTASLISEENRTLERSADQEQVAFAAGPGPRPSQDVTCHRCGLKGHFKATCRVNLNRLNRNNQNKGRDNGNYDLKGSRYNKFPRCNICKKNQSLRRKMFF